MSLFAGDEGSSGLSWAVVLIDRGLIGPMSNQCKCEEYNLRLRHLLLVLLVEQSVPLIYLLNFTFKSILTLFSSVCSGTSRKPCLAEIVHKEGRVWASVQSADCSLVDFSTAPFVPDQSNLVR